MADREVLKEFLVSLGFKIDKEGWTKFNKGLDTMSKDAKRVSAAIGGVAASATTMATVVASRLEKLYYLSKRTDATVANLQALEYGFGQVGASAEDARSTIDTFASGLQLNPGMRALLRTLGVADNKDPTLQFKGLMRRLAQMPAQIGVLWARQFGISDTLFRTLMRPGALDELDKAEQKNRELYQRLGVDQEAAASAGRDYINTLKQLWNEVSVLSEAISIDLLPYFHEMAKWATDTLPVIAKTISLVVKDLLAIESIDLNPKYLSGFFAEQLREWGEWGKLISNVYTLLGKLVTMLDSINPMTKLTNAVKMLVELLAKAGLISSEFLDEATSKVALLNRTLDKLLGRDVERLPQNTSGGKIKPPSGGTEKPVGGVGLPRGLSQNNPGNLRSWGQAAVRNGFASFSSTEEGLSAMAGNLSAYAKQGRVTLRDIISKWAPPNENKTEAYIAAAAKQLGVGDRDVLNMRDARTMAAVMGQLVVREQGYNPFTPAQLLAAASSRTTPEEGRTAGGVQLNAETTIIVQGQADPQGTARQVFGLQNRVNGNIVRDLSAQVR